MKLPKKQLSINDLPLFRCADQRDSRVPQTPAGQWVQRRYHVEPHLADIIAAQALLGSKK